MGSRRCGTRAVNLASSRSWMKTVNCGSRSATLALACQPERKPKFSMRFLRRNRKAPVWDWRSPVPSSSRMVAACGDQQYSKRDNVSVYTAVKEGCARMISTDHATVFVIDDDGRMRAAMQRLLKSVGLRSEVFATPQEFLRRKLPDGPTCLVLDVRLPGMSVLDVQ